MSSLRGRSHVSLRRFKDGGGRHLVFRENVNNSGLDKDICTKFYGKMHHGYAEMTTWPKVETKVSSRDVIKWTSEAYVCRSQWLQQIFEPNLVQNTNTTLSRRRNGQIHVNWKSKMAAAAIFDLGKMSITLDWIKISCNKLYRKMHHGHAEMTTDKSRNRKLIRVTSSNERL